MNTIKSTWYGWGVLCLAGGGAYYFAKKSINADRAARYEADMNRKAKLAAIEAKDRAQKAGVSIPSGTRKPGSDPSLQRAEAANSTKPASWTARDDVASPSREAGQDPVPTRHEPETDEEKLLEKSKYEPTEAFRPPRGNRFS